MGIVHHGRYLPYLEEARVEYLRHHRPPVHASGGRPGVDSAVLEVFVQYRQALRFDDVVDVHVLLASAEPHDVPDGLPADARRRADGHRGHRPRRRSRRPVARRDCRRGSSRWVRRDALVHVRPPLRARQHHPLLRPAVRRRRRRWTPGSSTAGTTSSPTTTRCGCSATWRWARIEHSLANDRPSSPARSCWCPATTTAAGPATGRRCRGLGRALRRRRVRPGARRAGHRLDARRPAGAGVPLPVRGRQPRRRPLRRPPARRRRRLLLHGHVHTRWQVDGRQVNVGCDVWDYRPVSEAELLAAIPTR